jgi:hypothetical protein
LRVFPLGVYVPRCSDYGKNFAGFSVANAEIDQKDREVVEIAEI